ncbi:MAG: hypothetical protein RBS73_17615 [Prolixibacteraceae bacterium]|nr:hypothetical protein [Prolixibacteraceae bacterium]
MKRQIKNLDLLIILGFVLGLSSCNLIYYDFQSDGSPSYTYEWPSHLWISKTEPDFLRGQGVASVDYSEEGIGIQPDKSTRTYFVDARSDNAYSNWSDYKVNYFHYYEDEDHSSGGFIPIVTTHYNETFKSGIALITPPAHLHMVLNSVDENPVGKIPAKTWEVVSVEDDNGQSLASDPDWSNYTDNLLRFKKTNAFVLYLGEKRTSIENDLFGSADSINGSYSVYMSNPYDFYSSKDYLSINFPGHSEKFEIVYSDWNNLTITGTIKGKTGTLMLSPK